MFSPDDLEKPARYDMRLFEPLAKEYPSLNSIKDLVFQQLRTHYQLASDIFANGNIYVSTLVLNGAITRSLNEYRGALWALGNGNPHVFNSCFRCHCETLALVHYCTLHPNYITAATLGKLKQTKKEHRIVRISKMIDELEKAHKGINLDYRQLCDLVHPNPASLYASMRPLTKEDDKELVVLISSRLIVSEEYAKLCLKMLTIWTDWIFEDLVKLSKMFKQEAH